MGPRIHYKWPEGIRYSIKTEKEYKTIRSFVVFLSAFIKIEIETSEPVLIKNHSKVYN